jgi:hypothetical protein
VWTWTAIDADTTLVPSWAVGRRDAFTAHAVYFMWYNFARIHQTLRVTPAMEAGVADHVWSAEEIAKLAN